MIETKSKSPTVALPVVKEKETQVKNHS